MRMLSAMAAAVLLAAGPAARAAEETFDACEVFTQAEAEKVLGGPAAGEPVNPKVKRPKVVPSCTYGGVKDGRPVAASVQFRFGKTNEEVQRAFDEHRLQVQTKPMIIADTQAAFWSAKTGQMNIRKGRVWVTLSVGPPKVSERDMNDAKKLAEILGKKI